MRPRLRLDPQGFRDAKDGVDRVLDTGPSPMAAVAPPIAMVSAFEGVANLSDNVPVAGLAITPSDVNLAVGPNHVFQMANLVGRVTDKSGGAALRFSTASLFNLDAGFGESDPSVLYDASTDRYFAIVIEFAFDTKAPQQSSVILVVSATGDPGGAFCRYQLGNPAFEAFVQDFPRIGISDDKIVVTYNAFSPDGTDFLGAGYYVVNKTDLVGCAQSPRVVRVPPNPSRYTIAPAHSTSSTGPLYMAMNGAGDSDLSTTLTIIAVVGTPGVGAVAEGSTVLGTRPWLIPPNAIQPGSGIRLSTNDHSVITAVWQRGSLWIGGNEGCVPPGDGVTRSCLRLIQVQTDLLNVAQDITLGSLSQYFYYPAVGLDGANNLIVVFNSSSSTDFVGVRVSGRRVTDPPNTLLPSLLIHGGGGAQLSPSARMGDFYGAAIDPADPTTVWVTGEYIRAPGQSDWGTYVAQIRLTPQPPPTLALTPNALSFSAGNTLRVDLTESNPGPTIVVDVYFGFLLAASLSQSLGCPAGDAVAFFTSGFQNVVVLCASGSPASFPRFATNMTLAAGLPPTTMTNFFSAVLPSVPAGQYVVFIVFVAPGGFTHGTVVNSDLVTFATATVTIGP